MSYTCDTCHTTITPGAPFITLASTSPGVMTTHYHTWCYGTMAAQSTEQADTAPVGEKRLNLRD